MPGGEIDIGLVIGISPNLVGNRRVHIFFCGIQIFPLAGDLVNKSGFGDSEPHFVLNATFFNEFTLRLPRAAAEVVEALAARGVLGGVPVSRLVPNAGLDDLLLVASTEVNSDDDRAALVVALKEILGC